MFVPRLERLEGREVPAGVVNTAFNPVSKTLTITASDDLVIAENHQDITLTGGGVAGNFAIVGNGGTAIDGDSVFTNVKHIRLVMGLGNDHIRFVTANLPGKLTVLGGHGVNSVTIGETVGNNIFGSVQITNLDGSDNFTMKNGFNQITGALVVNNGAGGSTFSFGEAVLDQCRFGSIAITNTAGADGFHSAGTLLEVTGKVTIRNGVGETFCNWMSGTVSVGGLTSIVNGNGHDLWSFSNGGAVTLHGLKIQNGAGGSNTILNGATNTILGDLTVINSDGPDQFDAAGIDVDNFKVSGKVTIQNGHGGGTTTIAANLTNEIGGKLTISNLSGTDEVQLGAGTGTIEFHQTGISNGNGDSSVLIAAGTATFTGSLSITNGDGDDVFDVGGANLTVTGALKLSNGHGDTTTDFHASVNTAIDGALNITNLVGDDTLAFSGISINLHNVTISNGNGLGSTTFTSSFGTLITGNLSVRNGQGDDTFDTDGPIWTVTGNVTIQNGDGGSSVKIDAGVGANIDNHIGGNLIINCQDSGDDIDLYKLEVGGKTSISTGDSNEFFDFITLANSEFAGPVIINSGGGTDFIGIENVAAMPNLNDNVDTIFHKKVTVIGGSGDDHLTIGLDATDVAVFNAAPIKLDGGLGLDTASGVGAGNLNTFPAGQPLLSGWEEVT